RNHGRSPHSEQQDFMLMAQDIETLCRDLSLDKVHVLGHSLGGKVAMQFAALQPEWLDKLVVVDISPRQYFSEHTPLMDAMMALNLDQYSSRKEVDEALADDIQDPGVRQFLLNCIRAAICQKIRWRPSLTW
ncbi:alpha/beta fold hydrolase, partial [uncultured Thalassolituus sp.]|uniref:alpha/beta fold hydrolase n=1 Tax=uncultured Thalassolituus sp. TaxID=285273 RepID=UPI00260E9170